MSLKNHSRISVVAVLRSALMIALCFGSLVGCASSRTAHKSTASAEKVLRLETQLRKAKARIETLRERNWVLQNRIKIIEANEGIDPAIAPSKLAAFPEGLELDVAINPTALDRPPQAGLRSNAALTRPTVTGTKRVHSKLDATPAVLSVAQAPRVIGESADSVLSRTVVELLKAGDEVEAERTAVLLEKSYPESELVAEARYQQGLYHFRKRNLSAADRYFRAAMSAPKAHVRARAGSALLRGVMASKAASLQLKSGTFGPSEKAHLEAARKSFSYVTANFPGSPEALRAKREARVLKRLEASAIARKK